MEKKVETRGDEKIVSIRFSCPYDVYLVVKRISLNKKMTMTDILVQYLEFLSKNSGPKALLNSESVSDFELVHKKERRKKEDKKL